MRLFAAVAFAIPVLAAASTTTFIVRELVSSLTTRQGSVEGLDPCVSLCGSQTLVGNSAAQECLAMTDFEAGIACVCGNNALVSSMTTCLKRECDNPDQVIALLCPDVGGSSGSNSGNSSSGTDTGSNSGTGTGNGNGSSTGTGTGTGNGDSNSGTGTGTGNSNDKDTGAGFSIRAAGIAVGASAVFTVSLVI